MVAASIIASTPKAAAHVPVVPVSVSGAMGAHARMSTSVPPSTCASAAPVSTQTEDTRVTVIQDTSLTETYAKVISILLAKRSVDT